MILSFFHKLLFAIAYIYMYVCVWMSVDLSVCIVFENVYQRYMYSNTHFPVEKHFYVYIVSI